MKKFIRKVKWTFFTIPKNAFEYANQNELRIQFVVGFGIILFILASLLGYVPTWKI